MFGNPIINHMKEMERLKQVYGENKFKKAAKLSRCTVNSVSDWIKLPIQSIDNALKIYCNG